MKVKDARVNGYTATLLAYANGERALWVRDNLLAGKSLVPSFSICDVNECVVIDGDEDIDQIINDWKSAVDWDAGESLFE